MTDEQTSALICFSGTNDGTHLQLCLGTDGDADRPYTFTMTVAPVPVRLPGPPPVEGTVSVTEQLSLSSKDLERLRMWIDQVAPRG